MSLPERDSGRGAAASPCEAAAGLDRFARSISCEAWFSALGEPATEAEAAGARRYLSGIGRPALDLRWVADLAAARDLLRASGWSRDWEAAEQDAVARLADDLDARMGRERATERLNRLMADAGTAISGPAAVAAARCGLADPGLIRAMTGAATLACFAMALAIALGETGHPLAARYHLFAGGRWPLVARDGAFHIL